MNQPTPQTLTTSNHTSTGHQQPRPRVQDSVHAAWTPLARPGVETAKGVDTRQTIDWVTVQPCFVYFLKTEGDNANVPGLHCNCPFRVFVPFLRLLRVSFCRYLYHVICCWLACLPSCLLELPCFALPCFALPCFACLLSFSLCWFGWFVCLIGVLLLSFLNELSWNSLQMTSHKDTCHLCCGAVLLFGHPPGIPGRDHKAKALNTPGIEIKTSVVSAGACSVMGHDGPWPLKECSYTLLSQGQTASYPRWAANGRCFMTGE